MVVLRTLVSASFTTRRLLRAPINRDLNSTPVRLLAALMSTQTVTKNLSKALKLVTVQGSSRRDGVETTGGPRPLVIMLAWLLAKKQYIDKYCEFYLRRGCDVLTVYITPNQVMWPIKGSQVVAEEILQYLLHNGTSRPLLLHGFSVGGYVWGEVLVKMNQDRERYQPIIDRIIGQTWDSAVDATEVQEGLSHAIFPRNPLLRKGLTKYIIYHLKVFDKQCTCHYIRASQMFHNNLVHSPALLLLSKVDPMGSIAANLRLKETWESMGIKVTWKCWDDSKHVSHYLKYKNEYIETLEGFLDSLNTTEKQKGNQLKEDSFLRNETQKEKLQAKL